MLGGDLFIQIGTIIIAAAGFALAAKMLRLPPLLGYVAAGIVLGPLVSHYLPEENLLESANQIGIAILLFLVGLELDWSRLKPQFKPAVILGLIQIAGSFLVGLILGWVLHLPWITGIYLGLAVSFSSAVVVTKLLSEAKDLNSLHGRLAVSTLLIQDLLAIIVLVVISGIHASSNLNAWEQGGLLIVKGCAVITLSWSFAKYILPPLFQKIAKSAEVLFICSIAWCFIFALSMELLNYPLEIGAFLAGLTLAPLPYSLEILGRIRSLRDFFVIILFVTLGSKLVLPEPAYLALTITLIVATIIGRPLIGYLTLSLSGYRVRTAFLTAITQGQLSEFTLIIAGLAIASQKFPAQLLSSLSSTVIISIFLSILAFNSRHWLLGHLGPILRLSERGHHRHPSLINGGTEQVELTDHVIIFGYHRMGYHILRKLLEMKQSVVVVDFNPDIVHRLRSEGITALYGDIEDEQILEATDAKHATMIISTIPHLEETEYLINTMKKLNHQVKLIVTAHQVDDALNYYSRGADYVLMPHMLGGEHIGELISRYQNRSLGDFLKQRAEEVKLLNAKKNALYID